MYTHTCIPSLSPPFLLTHTLPPHHHPPTPAGMSNRMAWATVLAAMIGAFFNTLALYVVVERAKKCLDFGTSLYGWHLILCLLYAGLPSAWEW